MMLNKRSIYREKKTLWKKICKQKRQTTSHNWNLPSLRQNQKAHTVRNNQKKLPFPHQKIYSAQGLWKPLPWFARPLVNGLPSKEYEYWYVLFIEYIFFHGCIYPLNIYIHMYIYMRFCCKQCMKVYCVAFMPCVTTRNISQYLWKTTFFAFKSLGKIRWCSDACVVYTPTPVQLSYVDLYWFVCSGLTVAWTWNNAVSMLAVIVGTRMRWWFGFQKSSYLVGRDVHLHLDFLLRHAYMKLA